MINMDDAITYTSIIIILSFFFRDADNFVSGCPPVVLLLVIFLTHLKNWTGVNMLHVDIFLKCTACVNKLIPLPCTGFSAIVQISCV